MNYNPCQKLWPTAKTALYLTPQAMYNQFKVVPIEKITNIFQSFNFFILVVSGTKFNALSGCVVCFYQIFAKTQRNSH